MKEFSSQLRKIMKLRNISQTDLCEKTSIPKSAISQYLSGAFKPKQERTYLLAQALETTPEYLMGLTDDPEPQQTEMSMKGESPMTTIYYPDAETVQAEMQADEPMLAAIRFDGETVVIASVDNAVEHHIMLAKAGLPSTDIDKYFRIVFDRSGADWTFVCPSDYKGITIKDRRIERFYKDGFAEIAAFLHSIGYLVGINIPKRYQRHLNMLRDDTTTI